MTRKEYDIWAAMIITSNLNRSVCNHLMNVLISQYQCNADKLWKAIEKKNVKFYKYISGQEYDG